MKASGGLVCQGVIDGENGKNGYNTVAVPLYRRSSSELNDGNRPSGTLTYTFSTGKLTGPSSYFNGWSQNIPTASANTKLYVIMAVARSQSDTDDIAASDWSTPVEYVADGMNSAPVFIYKRAESVSDKPADGAVYTFATGVLAGTLNGWSTNIPATDNNHYPCWVRQAMAVSRDTTDVINASEWSDATKLVEDGVSINSADIVFCLNNSNSSVPSDSATWKTTFAELDISSSNASKYVWQATKVVLSNGSTKYTGKQCLGKVSEFASIVEQFALGTASAATGTWQDNTPPSPSKGSYLWTRTKLTYSGGGNTYTPSENGQCVGYFGTDGGKGYSIALTLVRNNLYSDANWNTYAAIGHNESYTKRTGDDDLTACRVGDYFVVTGSSSDTGKKHTAIYKCTSVGSNIIYGDCVSHTNDGDNGDDAVTYDIVLNTAWAKVDSSGSITAGLAGTAYKIVGSTRSVLTSTTIRYGYILNDSTTYADTTTDGGGNFDAGTWFNGDYQDEYAKGSNSIFAAIIIDGSVKCVKYVTIANKGDKGDTGRMYYIAGEFPKKAPYSRTSKLCPVVYFGTKWWYLDAASATASDTPSDSSNKWKELQKFGVVLTDAIFVKQFAQFGAAIITGDWLISCHGTIGGVAYGGSVENPDQYNNRAAYTYFDPAYPQGYDPFQLPVTNEEIETNKLTSWTRITDNFKLPAGTYTFNITCYANSSDTLHLRLFYGDESADDLYLGSTISDEAVTLALTKTLTSKSDWNVRATMEASGEIGYIVSVEVAPNDARFIPNYAVDLRTGRSYQSDAHIKGTITSVGPNTKIVIGDGIMEFFGKFDFPNIVVGVDADGCAILNFYDKNGKFKYGLGPDKIIETLSQAESMKLTYYDVDAGSNDCTSLVDSDYVAIYLYTYKNQSPASAKCLYKYLAKISANVYGGNYVNNDDAQGRKFNGKIIKQDYSIPLQNSNIYNGGIVMSSGRVQCGMVSYLSNMLSGTSYEELDYRGYDVMKDSDFNVNKDGYVYRFVTKDPYNPTEAFYIDRSYYNEGVGYSGVYADKYHLNLCTDPEYDDKLIDPIYWFNLICINSEGASLGVKTLYINRSKLKRLLQDAGYSL